MAPLTSAHPVLKASVVKLMTSWVDPLFLEAARGHRCPDSPFGEEPSVYLLGEAEEEGPRLAIVLLGDPMDAVGVLALAYGPGQATTRATWSYRADDGDTWRLAEAPPTLLERLTPTLLQEVVDASCWQAFDKFVPVELMFQELMLTAFPNGLCLQEEDDK